MDHLVLFYKNSDLKCFSIPSDKNFFFQTKNYAIL